ncbi:Guanylate-binding protein 6 [Acropora cervicornis]|uniref:Guanylate-binding protein 6 n=1 Tax=Acropora cervicornis TaxID=6130 RepID=A0AAD9V9P2_ACRCE|nr:Guanylate-binding protein 6 [Acropora cervicornis]
MAAAIPICIPNNCSWNESSQIFKQDKSQPRSELQLVDEALRKLRSIHGPVCVVSIAGPCRKGKSYILSRIFDQPNVFGLGNSFDPETMGMWMWVVPEKYRDNTGQEFTVVLLDSEGIDAVGSQVVNDHAIFILSVLLSSVLIYNSVGVPTRTDLETLEYPFHLSPVTEISQKTNLHKITGIQVDVLFGLEVALSFGIELEEKNRKDAIPFQHFLTFRGHIINLCRRIQLLAGEKIDDETARRVFPSFVWLLRDVVLQLPKGIENLKKYFLEKVFKTGKARSDKSQKVVDNILKYFPDFDAFPLCPPSADPEVIQDLPDSWGQGTVDSSFVEGVENFKRLMKPKLCPKKSFVGPGLVTGEALAILFEEYVREINTPGAVPIVQNAWDVVTENKCTEFLENAKAVYNAGMKELCLPCDDMKIRRLHETQFVEALSFFENNTEDIDLAARWKYIEKLADYANEEESVLLRDNNRKTELECDHLIKSLREIYLEPVFSDLRDPDCSDFVVMEERLRSAYAKIEIEFSKQAPRSSLSSNCGYVYERQHSKEMKQNLDQVKFRRKYSEEIASERKARELQAEETEKMMRANALLKENTMEIENKIAQLTQEYEEEHRELLRTMAEEMKLQQQEAQSAITKARASAETDRQTHLQQRRQLQAQIEEIRQRMRDQNDTINSLQEKLRRM